MRGLLLLLMMTVCAALWADPQMEGLASWYGGKFHGRLTSSGEVFDTNTMTAAHKILPFGTLVKVTNLDNGLSAVVKINDRGPFVEGRVIDLSRAAADQIGMLGQGVAPVSLEILAFASTDKEVYAIQVGAYGLEANAERARAALESAGFYVTIEKTTLNVARVLVRGVPAAQLPAARRKLESIGFVQYLLRREKTEDPAQAQALLQPQAPGQSTALAPAAASATPVAAPAPTTAPASTSTSALAPGRPVTLYGPRTPAPPSTP